MVVVSILHVGLEPCFVFLKNKIMGLKGIQVFRYNIPSDLTEWEFLTLF